MGMHLKQRKNIKNKRTQVQIVSYTEQYPWNPMLSDWPVGPEGAVCTPDRGKSAPAPKGLANMTASRVGEVPGIQPSGIGPRSDSGKVTAADIIGVLRPLPNAVIV